MSTVAQTSIQIDTSQAVAGIQKLNINLNATLGGFEGLEKALNANTEALRRAKTAGDTYNITQNNINNNAKQGQSAFAGLKSKIIGLATAYISLQSAQKFMQEADSYASTAARLNVMNDGLQTTDELYHKIYQSAQRSRGAFNETANAITKLGIVAGDAFKNNDEIIAFIETFNKAAVVSGSSATEASNAMYQLSQAFASGRLQGDELRSVRENAPMLFKAIQKELEAQWGKNVDFKKLAADGLITPDVIKRAAFKSADDINKAFKSMPLTFGQIMTQAFNKIKAALAPVFKEVSKIINNPGFKNGINSVVNFAIQGIYWVWGAIKKLGFVVGWIINTFDYWKWAMYGVLAVLTITKTATMLQAFWNGILAVKTAILTFVESVRTKGLWATFAAMLAVNTTMLITVAIIVAIIAVIILIIQYLDYVVGAAYWCGAAFSNAWMWTKQQFTLAWLGMKLSAQKTLNAILEFSLTIAEKVANAFIDAFNGVAKYINGIVDKVGNTKLGKKLGVSGLKIEEKKRVDLVGGSSLLQRNKAAEKELQTEYNKISGQKLQYKNLSEAYNKGKAQGAEWKQGITSSLKGVGDKLGLTGNGNLSDMLKGGVNGIPTGASLDNALGTVGNPSSFGGGNDAIKKSLGDIADNTAQTAKNTGKEDEYEMFVDVMKQRAISRVGNSGGVVKIDMINNNSLSSKLDINSFLSQLVKTIEEAASTSAKAVHN